MIILTYSRVNLYLLSLYFSLFSFSFLFSCLCFCLFHFLFLSLSFSLSVLSHSIFSSLLLFFSLFSLICLLSLSSILLVWVSVEWETGGQWSRMEGWGAGGIARGLRMRCAPTFHKSIFCTAFIICFVYKQNMYTVVLFCIRSGHTFIIFWNQTNLPPQHLTAERQSWLLCA